MKKISILFSIFFCISQICDAQIWQKPTIDIGIGFRGNENTIVDGREQSSFRVDNTFYRFNTNGEEFSGKRLLIDFIEKLPGKNNLSLSLSTYITLKKYNTLKKVVTNPNDAYSKRFRRDYFVDVLNNFKIRKKKTEIVVGLGAGVVNAGTNFKIAPTGLYASYGSETYGTNRLFASRLQVGLNKKPFKAQFILYSLGRENLLYPKFWMEGKLAYTINPFEKKDKIFQSSWGVKKWKIPSIDIGLAFRLQAITLENNPNNYSSYSSKYLPLQDSKTRLYVGIKEKLFKRGKLYISLANYITYRNINNEKPDYRFKRDHIIDITNEFKTKKDGLKFIVGAGIGLMNCGTNFIDPPNNSSFFYTSSLRFLAPRLILGLQKNKYNFSIITHGTPNLEGEPYPTLWFESKFTYDLNLFRKKN